MAAVSGCNLLNEEESQAMRQQTGRRQPADDFQQSEHDSAPWHVGYFLKRCSRTSQPGSAASASQNMDSKDCCTYVAGSAGSRLARKSKYFPSLSWLQIVHLYCQDTDWFINSLPGNQIQEKKWKYRFRLKECTYITYISQTRVVHSYIFFKLAPCRWRSVQSTTSKRNGGIAVNAARSGDIGVRVGTAEERLAKVGDALHEVNKLHNS